MTTPEKTPLERLREPFPANVVGTLPKPYKKDSPRGTCFTCGGYHGLPAAHLDFVGHAAITDRLLSVDPEWNWEPMHRQIDPTVMAAALASGNPECVRLVIENSPPALDKDGNLWIRLTVCGMMRLGVGDGPNMKERIGDALRNAAMRFGVALSLWSKDELESGYTESKPETTNSRSEKQKENGNASEKDGALRPTPAPRSEGERQPDTSPVGDPSAMSMLDLTNALNSAGLPLTGNRKVKEQRLMEYRANGASSNGAVAVLEKTDTPLACCVCGGIGKVETAEDGKTYCPDDLPF